MKDAEDIMKILWRRNFTQSSEFGAEYFKGDLSKMTKMLYDVAIFSNANLPEDGACQIEGDEYDDEYKYQGDSGDKENRKGSVTEIAEVSVSSPADTDTRVLLGKYFHTRIIELSLGPVDSAVLLNNVASVLSNAGCKQIPTLNGIINYLQKYFGIKEITHEFPDGCTRDAIIFQSKRLSRAVEKVNTQTWKPFADYKAFMALSDEKRKVNIKYQVGDLVWLLDFEAAYNAVMDVKVSPWGHGLDPHMLSEMGFELSEKKVNVCLACKKPIAIRMSGKCCAAYKNKDRRDKHVIYNMHLHVL